ncbi:hypothetical protein [Phaeobacter phage MD18]|nr:hypothetical protein [Phaeobacter phage MD18]
MGCHPNITKQSFPAQSNRVGRNVLVAYHYDTSDLESGTIIRDDTESPHLTLIQTDGGRTLLATECQYQETMV